MRYNSILALCIVFAVLGLFIIGSFAKMALPVLTQHNQVSNERNQIEQAWNETPKP